MLTSKACVFPSFRITKTSAKRFRNRFLGGEAIGNKPAFTCAVGKLHLLIGIENAANELLTILIEQSINAAFVNQVYPDACNHEL